MSIRNRLFIVAAIVNVMSFSSVLSNGDVITIEQLNQLQENIKQQVLESVRNVENELKVSLAVAKKQNEIYEQTEKIRVAAAVQAEVARLENARSMTNDSDIVGRIVFGIIIVVLCVSIINYGMPIAVDYFKEQNGLQKSLLSGWVDQADQWIKKTFK
jgi:hypothetical protein